MFKKGQPGAAWWRDGKRRCSHCEGYYEPVAFASRRLGARGGGQSARDGLDIYCRECRRACRQRSYQRHRDAQIAYVLDWRKRNRRRYLDYTRRYRSERRTVERLSARQAREAQRIEREERAG